MAGSIGGMELTIVGHFQLVKKKVGKFLFQARLPGMPALFTQSRNGHVSIIRNLMQAEAEKARDIALRGPEARAEKTRWDARWAERRRVAAICFAGNKSLKCVSGEGWVIYREGEERSYGEQFYHAYLALETPGDIVRAEIIDDAPANASLDDLCDRMRITPAMIEAGVEAFGSYHHDFESAESFVTRLYQRMVEADERVLS